MILSLLIEATLATLYMVAIASLIATLVGIPLGVLLYLTQKQHIFARPFLNMLIGSLLNMLRSIPFLILMIAVFPITRWLVGTSIGTTAAIVPLSLAAIPFIGRVTESALMKVDKGLIEAAQAMGATSTQIVFHVLLPESLPSLIQGITLTIINLVGYSTMAGAVGGGGLGDLAIRYGYQRFEVKTMLMTLIIIVALVQIIQWIGNSLSQHIIRLRKS